MRNLGYAGHNSGWEEGFFSFCYRQDCQNYAKQGFPKSPMLNNPKQEKANCTIDELVQMGIDGGWDANFLVKEIGERFNQLTSESKDLIERTKQLQQSCPDLVQVRSSKSDEYVDIFHASRIPVAMTRDAALDKAWGGTKSSSSAAGGKAVRPRSEQSYHPYNEKDFRNRDGRSCRAASPPQKGKNSSTRFYGTQQNGVYCNDDSHPTKWEEQKREKWAPNQEWLDKSNNRTSTSRGGTTRIGAPQGASSASASSSSKQQKAKRYTQNQNQNQNKGKKASKGSKDKDDWGAKGSKDDWAANKGSKSKNSWAEKGWQDWSSTNWSPTDS